MSVETEKLGNIGQAAIRLSTDIMLRPKELSYMEIVNRIHNLIERLYLFTHSIRDATMLTNDSLLHVSKDAPRLNTIGQRVISLSVQHMTGGATSAGIRTGVHDEIDNLMVIARAFRKKHDDASKGK